MIKVKLAEKPVGTCGECNGPVVVPRFRLPFITYIPRCKGCKKVPVDAFGSVIEMNKETNQQDDSRIGF